MKSQNITELYNRAESYLQEREYDKAITELIKVIEMDPENADAYVKRGYAYNKKGNCDKAIEDSSLAIDLDPKNVEAYANRGMFYAQKGDYGKALEDTNSAIELDPKNSKVYFSRGYVYSQKGDCDKAIEDFNSAIKMDPKHAKAYYNRGLSYAQKGDYNKAIADLEKYLEFEPGGEVATEAKRLLNLSKSKIFFISFGGLFAFFAGFLSLLYSETPFLGLVAGVAACFFYKGQQQKVLKPRTVVWFLKRILAIIGLVTGILGIVWNLIFTLDFLFRYQI